MKFLKTTEGYIPAYTRTDFTDDLHEAFGFRTDYQILTKSTLKEIFTISKNFSHSTKPYIKKTPQTCFIAQFREFFLVFGVKDGAFSLFL